MLTKWTHPQVKLHSPGFLTMCWDAECIATCHITSSYRTMESDVQAGVSEAAGFELFLVALSTWAVGAGWAPGGDRRGQRREEVRRKGWGC